MRIGIVSNAYHPDIGGVETHVKRLCAGLTAAGDDVEVITQHAVRSVETVDGVLVRRFPLTVPAGNYRLSVPLWRWLRAHAGDYDVLHAHSYHALTALCAALGNRSPLVFTPHYHGTGHTRFRAALHPFYRPLGRTIMNRASAVVCVTSAERDLVLRDFPEVGTRAVVIPNGTDPRPARRHTGSAKIRRILCVGRLEQYKRVDRVIRAMTRLSPEHRLDVVGTGPAGDRLRQLAAGLGLAGRVVFHGRLDDAAFDSCVSSASAAVSASAHEAFGMAVADALAAGLPTVATPIPAHREVAGLAGDSAWLRFADADDETALAAALKDAAATARTQPAILPTWPDVVTATRNVYAAVSHRAVADRPAPDRTAPVGAVS